MENPLRDKLGLGIILMGHGYALLIARPVCTQSMVNEDLVYVITGK